MKTIQCNTGCLPMTEQENMEVLTFGEKFHKKFEI